MDAKVRKRLHNRSIHLSVLILFHLFAAHLPPCILASDIAPVANDSNSNGHDGVPASPFPDNHSVHAIEDDDDDEYIDLEDMTDKELEEICTSRGFELVREVDPTTGEPMVYTHRDYVDAASECLQIEADLYVLS